MSEDPKHFVAEITYRAPEQTLAPFMEAHVAHLKDGAEQRVVLAFGGKPAGGGGIVILRCLNEEAARKFMAQDPFVENGLVDVTLTAFNASFWQTI
ncbi:MAG: YciI family protein [Rhodobacteraceae bacterium]|jgi:uncharacterized protein YciI|nr:YciI family protein [Paracoccaceae bacterium]